MIQEHRNHPLYQVLRQNHPTLYISRLKVLVSLGNPERGARGAKTVSSLMIFLSLMLFDFWCFKIFQTSFLNRWNTLFSNLFSASIQRFLRFRFVASPLRLWQSRSPRHKSGAPRVAWSLRPLRSRRRPSPNPSESHTNHTKPPTPNPHRFWRWCASFECARGT